MIDINGQTLDKKYKLLVNKYKNIEIFKLDISSEVQIKNLIIKLNKKKIFVRVIINNACIDPKQKKIKNNNKIIKTWDNELKVGLKGAYLITELFSKR